MSKWYGRIMSDPENFEIVLAACDWFEGEYQEARKELKTQGRRIEEISANMPGVIDYRWGQLQEIEGIMVLLETRESKIKTDKMRGYLEHYNRVLSDRTAEKYADAHEDVQTIRLVRQQVALVRNLFLGFFKAFDSLNFRIGDITKLRSAGMEDATL